MTRLCDCLLKQKPSLFVIRSSENQFLFENKWQLPMYIQDTCDTWRFGNERCAIISRYGPGPLEPTATESLKRWNILLLYTVCEQRITAMASHVASVYGHFLFWYLCWLLVNWAHNCIKWTMIYLGKLKNDDHTLIPRGTGCMQNNLYYYSLY